MYIYVQFLMFAQHSNLNIKSHEWKEKLSDVLALLEATELTDEQQAVLEGIVGGSGSHNGALSNCDTNNCNGGNCGNCVSGCT